MGHAIGNKNSGFTSLFSPLVIGGHRIKNRIVALPVHTGFAYPDGRVSPWQEQFYSRLAESGPGMVIVANAAVSKDGTVSRFNLRADRDGFIPGMKRLATAIKKGGAVACIQLNHAGRFARFPDPLLPSPISRASLAFNVESLKAFMEFFPFEKRFGLTRHFLAQLKAWNRGMTEQERERVIDDFASAAARACRAGFDMVELHGANGYLLCQYLSPFTNKLQTGYGPDFISRTLFPLRVFRAVKDRLPDGFPIGFRLILKEWVPDGIDLPEALEFARFLEKEGVAYLSVSAGTYNSIFSPDILIKMALPAYLQTETARLKQMVRVPVIAAGRITLPAQADKLIQNGMCDMAGLGRPLIVDPKWVKKAETGSGHIITCINCNRCLKHVVLDQGFNCSRWPKIVQERTRLEHSLLTRRSSSLWIITGIKDIQTFKSCWPLVDPGKGRSAPARLLFLETTEPDDAYRTARNGFVQWLKSHPKSLDLRHDLEYHVICDSKSRWEDLILEEIEKNGSGQVILCPDRGQPWRNRLLYKQRRRVMGTLSFSPHLHRVLVPVDFSPATLLVLKFLQRSLMKNKDFYISFVHIIPGRWQTIENPARQWEKIKRIIQIDKAAALTMIPGDSDVATILLRIIKEQRFGTVVMGKRGLSGIKRWLLGSVSSAVMNRLTDQTLFLID